MTAGRRAAKRAKDSTTFDLIDEIDQSVATIGGGLKVLAALAEDLDEHENRCHAEIAYYLVATMRPLVERAQEAAEALMQKNREAKEAKAASNVIQLQRPGSDLDSGPPAA